MIKIAVFGPTKGVTKQDWKNLERYLDSLERPLLIVTSTCQGWDNLGRKYAGLNELVDKKVIKARIKQLGYKKGVETCNQEITGLVDSGVTCKNPETTGTKHMIKMLESQGKKIIYLG
jgi:hypothetical protein